MPYSRPTTPGFILWFTGLPSSGKTSLGHAVASSLSGLAPVQIIDGDQLRTTLSRDLSFSPEHRLLQTERAGYVARLLAHHGIVALVATISPYRDARAQERLRALAAGIPFIEVYLEAKLTTLRERDVKGLYRRAGEQADLALTGVSAPYEPPVAPDIHIRTDAEPLAESRDRILDAIRKLGLWPAD